MKKSLACDKIKLPHKNQIIGGSLHGYLINNCIRKQQKH